MKQISIHSVEHLPEKIIAIETQYPNYYVLDMHQHKRAQLLYGAQGVIHVETEQGNWVIPPERAIWIPPQVRHKLTMFQVKTCSLYILADFLPRQSNNCQVLSISPLFRQLLLKAPELNAPFTYHDELIFKLILMELAQAKEVNLHLPLPKHSGMLKICQDFMKQPDIHLSPEDCSEKLYMSERHFSRVFKYETGISFSRWRQQACVLLSLERLIQKQSIQQVAFDFGFKNPAAFSTMFSRILGVSPRHYMQNHDLI